MYAKADLHYATSQTSQVATRTNANRAISPAAVRSMAVRFLNWFGSGSSQPHVFKAELGHGTDFMLINGQVIANPSCREATGADQFTK